MIVLNVRRNAIIGWIALLQIIGFQLTSFSQERAYQNQTISADSARDSIPDKITVVDDRTYAPFAFFDQQGNPCGITIDIWNLWSQKTGIEVQFQLMEWKSALDAVRKGEADVVGGLFRTPDREEIYDFTQSFYRISTGVFFQHQIMGIRGLDELTGFFVGVVKGDSAEELIRERSPSIHLESFPDAESMIVAAIQGKIKVFVADTYVARFYLAKHGAGNEILEAFNLLTDHDQYAAVKKGNDSLLAVLNNGFKKISKEEIQSIVQKWTGKSLSPKVPWNSIGILLAIIAAVTSILFLWNLQLKRKVNQTIDELRQRNEDIQKTEQNYREIFNSSSDMIILHDADNGRILDLNKAAIEKCGYTREKLINHTVSIFSEGTPPYTEEEALIRIHKAAQEGFFINEWYFRRSDGSTFWAEVALRSAWIDGIKRVLAFIRDITERKKTEDALRESEAKHRALTDHSSDLLWSLNPEGFFTYASPSWKRLTGYNPSEIVGKSYKDIVHPEAIPACEFFFDRLVKSKKITQTPEYRAIHADGSIQWHVGTDAPVLNENGELISIVGITRVVTEHKRAKEELERERLQMKTLLDSLPGIFYLYSYPELRLKRWNKNHESLLGYGPGEIDDFHILDWHTPESKDAVMQAIEIGMERGINQLETPLLTKDGRSIPFLLTGVRLEMSGRTYILGVGIDITEHKTVEEERERLHEQLMQAQKMESVGRLAGGVAHDFNNMLGVILGHTELALTKVDDGHSTHGNLQEIQKAAKRSADLTRQLLAFARKQTITPIIMDLNEAIESMMKMLIRLIGEDIDLVWKPKEDLWPVKIDPTQIDQILINLTVNARDAIGQAGRIIIETNQEIVDDFYCASNEEARPGEYVSISVSDNGCGMDNDTLSNIFEPFFTTKGLGKGTGLGLSAVYGSVKQNEGFINVYSEPKQGSTFHLFFPRYSGKAIEKDEERSPDEPISGRETILLVEDEEMLLQLTNSLLEELGYVVFAASKPAEALELARENPERIDLLITDVVMPEINGKELAFQLQSMNSDLKCLFMSGYTADAIAHHGVLDEGVRFIQKPFSLQTLAMKVRETIDN